jgi:hypothetical protein
LSAREKLRLHVICANCSRPVAVARREMAATISSSETGHAHPA